MRPTIPSFTIDHGADHPGVLGPLPIVIGSTGHRDLRPDDIPILEERVRSILVELRERLPHTPIHIISPLAEGADRLVARVALAAGCRVIVPLPMPRAIYITDFESEESRAEFEELERQAHEVFELPIEMGTTAAEISEHCPKRDHQYGLLGAYIVRNSHALIALWDGLLPERSNGTADVVGFNLTGVPERFTPSRSLLEPNESDPVWHILTPRLSNPSVDGEPLSLRTLYPSRTASEKEGEERFAKVLQGTERFNHDALRYEKELEKENGASLAELFNVAEGKDLVDRDEDLSATRRLFAVADSLASRFSRHTHRTLTLLFAIVTGAVIVFDLYTHIYITLWPLLLTYLLLLVATYALVVRSRKQIYQSRYLDYRALAEGLRVRFFWHLAGIDDEIADHYLHKQRSELDWIRYGLRVWSPTRGMDHSGIDEAEEMRRLTLVQQAWVEDQFGYYAKAAKREEKRMHTAEKRAAIMVVIGIVLALFQVIQQGFIDPAPEKQPIHWLLVIVSLAPILAGLLLGYVEKRAHGDHARQYERMSILFANARQHLERLIAEHDLTRARRLIEELGREALAENGDWVLIHRDRPIEVPKA